MSDTADAAEQHRRRVDNVIELARGKGVTLDRSGGVRLPDLTPKQRKELLGAEIGTQFDMYTRMFAAFSGGDVFEIGEWRVRDLDAMLSRDGTAKALEQVLTLPMRSAAFSFQAAPNDTGELELILQHFASPSEAVASGNLGETTGPIGACAPGLRTIIGQMSMASIYRKAFFEKRYVMSSERNAWGSPLIRLSDLSWRPPATCEVKRDEHTAKFDGFRQRAWWFFSDPTSAKKRFAKEWGKNFTGYLDIPKQRSFVYIHGQHRNPLIGVSDMDVPYWALAHGSLVQTPRGPRRIEKLNVGDDVFAVDGSIQQVTGVHPRGVRPMYRLIFADGSSVRCDEEHQWEVSVYKYGKETTGVLSTKQLLEGKRPDRPNGRSSYRAYTVRACAAVEYPEQELSEDPYKFGCGVMSQRYRWDAIPLEFLRGSIAQRKDLLAGICDHPGRRNQPVFSKRTKKVEIPVRIQLRTQQLRLAANICALVESLGGVAYRQSSNGEYRISFVTPFNPFRNSRHTANWRPPTRPLRRHIKRMIHDGESECRCITVSGEDHLFLTNSYIPTHNCYKQKLKLMFLWWQFLENQSLPKIAAYGADQTQADDNADAIASMRTSAVGGFLRPPPGQKLFDVIEASGAGAAQFVNALNFLDNFQTLSVLAGFLNLPSAAMLGRGSYALSESQTDFFNKSRQGIIYEMQEGFTRDVIAPIVILNRGPDAAIPRLTSTALSAVDNAQILSVFSQLATAPALRIPDQFADMMAEKVAAIFDLPLDRVAKVIIDGAKIRAMQNITNSPIGATAAGQATAQLASTLDATFTVLQGAGAGMGEENPSGIGTGSMGLDGGVNGGGQSVQEDLNRG